MTAFLKNASLLRLPEGFQLQLQDDWLPRLRSPGPLELETRGFVSPHADESMPLTLPSGDALLFAAGRESRMLPGPVLARAVQTFVAEYESRTGRKPGARLRNEFKEKALADLLPRAVIQYSRTLAYWDPVVRLLVIDSTSARTVEGIAAMVREAIGNFPARPLATEGSLALQMSEWLRASELPDGFEFGARCQLVDPCDQSSCVTVAGGDLTSDEVRAHVQRGFQVRQLELIYKQRLGFTLDTHCQLRRIQVLDVIADQLDSNGDAEALFEAEFALIHLELRQLLQALDQLLTFVD